MPTQQKVDRVQNIKDRLERSSIVMTTSYAGISVNQMIELRRAMRAGGVEFTIAKNTLLALAADEAQKPQLKEIVNGPTAIAFGYDDPVAAAKAMADFIRTGGTSLAVIGAVMGDGAPMSSSEFSRLAALPPKTVLLAMLLGQMQSPLARLLTIMNGPLQNMSNVLQARVRQLEEEGPANDEPAAETTGDTPADETSAIDEPAAEAEGAPEAMTEPEAEAAEEGPEAEPEQGTEEESE